jgi:D-psicose/D-tagatose/L-ribulose 3-epimerase
MNIEEKNIGEAITAAGDKVFHFQVSENDRGTPAADMSRGPKRSTR